MSPKRTTKALAALLLPLSLIAAGCSDDEETTTDSTTETTEAPAAAETTEAPAAEAGTIVDIAASDPQFSTLVELVTAAGLAETLSGDGPFTVFAPTNDAFAKVPAETLASLGADPTGALTDVLKLHVIAGEVDAAAATAAAGTSVETLGGMLKVEKVGDNLTIGGATIIKTDIKASNGIIHVIDSVITTANG